MERLQCSWDTSLLADEEALFLRSLERRGLAVNAWELFGEWAERSTDEVRFLYLKVRSGAELVGLALFVRIHPVDLRTSYAGLRRSPSWSKLAGYLSTLTNNCIYVSFRNLITSNLCRPFFARSPDMEDEVMAAILSWLKEQDDADMVSIVDTTGHDGLYHQQGYIRYPSSSEAYLDAARYGDIFEYLREHRSLMKNLARRKSRVNTEIAAGPVSSMDMEQMWACVECSARLSKVNNPCQQFFEDHILETGVFRSDSYLHIRIRVDGVIAGFHTFLVSGSHMGGVLGGFNRQYTRNNFVYERVIVASLDHAIREGLERVHYSLIDNHTKLRLVQEREPCGLYFFSRSAMNRKVFDLTYKYSDVHDLYLLETG